MKSAGQSRVSNQEESTMTDDFPGNIRPRVFDHHVDTAITISCYRETHRLERMLKVFQKCLTIVADEYGHDDAVLNFRGAIRKLHDSKGELLVTWRSPADFANHHRVVQKAWEDCGESTIIHMDRDGHELKLRLGIRPSLPVLRSDVPHEDHNWTSVGDASNSVMDSLRKRMKESK